MVLCNAEHRAFEIETYFKNSDSFTQTQRLLRNRDSTLVFQIEKL